jgi:hypothetical protein
MVSGDAPATVVYPTPPMGERVSVLGTALQFADRVLQLVDGERTEPVP